TASPGSWFCCLLLFGFCKSAFPPLVAYLIVFHVIFVFFIWTYWKSVFTPPQQPDKKFHMSYSDKERYENEERPEAQRQILAEMAQKLPVYTRTGNGAIRFCDRCQLIKPDRCHHCSVCAMCVLKMDHHCPWVNNCIGFSNYKFFLLFLAYSLLYCMYIAATVLKYFIKYWTGELSSGRSKIHIFFLLFVAIMFFVSLMFLFGYHCLLVSQNRSTLEAFSAPVFLNGPDKNGFNLGFVQNLQQVFGEEKRLWLFPVVSSKGDGHSFPRRRLNEAQNPLLANEEQWEDDRLEDDNPGEDAWTFPGPPSRGWWPPQGATHGSCGPLKTSLVMAGLHWPGGDSQRDKGFRRMGKPVGKPHKFSVCGLDRLQVSSLSVEMET
uniref:Palmitoyltransferase n=1 Tax=Varanus komodoensis TaxID=61221 RepID=A0A8D2L525_VARKO